MAQKKEGVFGKKKFKPADVVKVARSGLLALRKGAKKDEKVKFAKFEELLRLRILPQVNTVG